MSLEGHLTRARRRERKLWKSECLVSRPVPSSRTLDPDTGALSDPSTSTVYDGDCQARLFLADRDSELTVGEEMTDVVRYVVKIPLGLDVHRGDLVRITRSRDNVGLVGKSLTVRKVESSEWSVCRRLICEEVMA